jgi:hypothetical protein
MTAKTKTYHVSLTVEILVCLLEIDENCPDDALEMIARESISLCSTGREDTTLEIEHIEVNDIVEITREASDAG